MHGRDSYPDFTFSYSLSINSSSSCQEGEAEDVTHNAIISDDWSLMNAINQAFQGPDEE